MGVFSSFVIVVALILLNVLCVLFVSKNVIKTIIGKYDIGFRTVMFLVICLHEIIPIMSIILISIYPFELFAFMIILISSIISSIFIGTGALFMFVEYIPFVRVGINIVYNITTGDYGVLENYKNDYWTCYNLIDFNPRYYKGISNRLKYNRRIIRLMRRCKINITIVDHDDAIIYALTNNETDKIPVEYMNDREFVTRLIGVGFTLRVVPNEFRNDVDIAKSSIKWNISNYTYMSSNLKQDKELLNELLDRYPEMYRYILMEDKCNYTIILNCLKKADITKWIPETTGIPKGNRIDTINWIVFELDSPV